MSCVGLGGRLTDMKDDRERVPVDDHYVEALGRATYVFATLEWNAVWCCERLDRGYINKLERKTAGRIATDLLSRVSRIGDPVFHDACNGPAREFQRLVKIRNSILHGKPGTADDNAQRLFSEGRAWSPEMVEDAADDFAACSINLNALLYAELKDREV